MKKLLALICLSFVLGCDDGDLAVETINFDDVTAQKCDLSNVIYKISGQEALLLEVNGSIGSPTDFNIAFINEPTPEGAPRIIPIGGNVRVLYRSYSGTVAENNICGSIPPATPSVTEEWNATAGTIEIVTTVLKSANPNLAGGERITAYRHNIVLKNVTFDKPSGTQVYQTFNFGDYNAPVTSFTLTMNPLQLAQCESGKLYNAAGPEAFTLDIDPALIVNEVTPIGSPRTGLLSQDLNRLEFRRYSAGGLTPDHFCSSTPPSAPEQIWVGADGIDGISGIVEVTTTTSGGFLHEVRLINATLTRGNVSFKLADDFLLGSFITN